MNLIELTQEQLSKIWNERNNPHHGVINDPRSETWSPLVLSVMKEAETEQAMYLNESGPGGGHLMRYHDFSPEDASSTAATGYHRKRQLGDAEWGQWEATY